MSCVGVGAGLGPALLLHSGVGWNPTGTALKSLRGGGDRGKHGGWEWIRVLWKCSRTLLLKPHRHPPNLAHQVGCLYVWGSNLIFTQPWDCFLNTTTAATWFCCFGVVFFCLGLISPLYRNTRFLGELRYISAFWKYFLEAYARAIDQILRDPCWHSILNRTFLILIVMKYCQAEVLVLYQTVFPSESMPDANKSKQFSPLPFFL